MSKDTKKIISLLLLLSLFFSLGIFAQKNHIPRKIIYIFEETASYYEKRIYDNYCSINADYCIPGYDEFGIVKDQIAYFSSEQKKNNSVIAYDLKNKSILRQYDFGFSYGCAPIVEKNSNNEYLIINHEVYSKSIVALSLGTGELKWKSKSNMPGTPMGMGIYDNKDGIKLILVPSSNGLHCVSIDDGKEIWWVKRPTPSELSNPVTPAIDQENGFIYYQFYGGVVKINAESGEIIKEVVVYPPSINYYNTLLVKKNKEYFVVTYFRGYDDEKGMLITFDKDLNKIWTIENIQFSKGPSYSNHKVIMPVDKKTIKAFDIKNGKELWKTELDKYDFEYLGSNLVVGNNYVYALTADQGKWGPYTRKLFLIREEDGYCEKYYDLGTYGSSCGAPIISGGMILFGNLYTNSIDILVIGNGKILDYPGPFGDNQLNHCRAFDDSVNLSYYDN